MKKYVTAATVAALLVGWAGVAAAPASAGVTHVVCANNDYMGWHTAVHPESCNFHRRGDCWCHAGLAQLRSIHWRRWDARRARGKGKETFTGGVTVKERVDLFRSRWGWTPWTRSSRFFSRAKIRNRFGSFTMKLDVPQSRWLP